MARTSSGAMPLIKCSGDGYAALAAMLLIQPVSVAMGDKEGDKEQAFTFLESEFAGVLLDGLNVNQAWLLERLRHEPGA